MSSPRKKTAIREDSGVGRILMVAGAGCAQDPTITAQI